MDCLMNCRPPDVEITTLVEPSSSAYLTANG